MYCEGPCRLTLELVSEEVPTAELSSLYPFNALRNHALLLVKTEVGANRKKRLLLLALAVAAVHVLVLVPHTCVHLTSDQAAFATHSAAVCTPQHLHG